VSVLLVVPTLGLRAAYLSESLASIARQGVDGLDLVVVGPEGKGLEAEAVRYGGRFLPDPGRGGLSGALNAGLAAALPGTRYFTWLGDDDVLAEGSLRASTDALDRHPDAVMAFGWCDYIDMAGRVIFRNHAGRIAARTITWGPNLIPQPGCLFRLADVVAVGGLDESVRLAMDLDLYLRLRQRGRLLAVPQTLASFRWHSGSATVSGESVSTEESDQLRMKYMGPISRRLYRVLRWPGRLALWLVKRRVDMNAAHAAADA
jgi:GT2 family glycosyltransferase